MSAYPYGLVATIPGAPESASPGVCYFCGSGQQPYQDERFPAYAPALDLATAVEFEGFLYACANCVIEWAHLYGMMDTAKVNEIKANNRTLGRRNQILEQKLSEAVDMIQSLTRKDEEFQEG